ncbi:MAG: MFS transporter [Solirubrobacteraceae bacterium]
MSTTRHTRRSHGRARRGGGGEPIPRESWMRLFACTGAAALLQIDGTLVTVALPSVAHGLHVSSATTAIVLSAYFLPYALILVPAGRLVDRFEARRVALLGLAVFGLGALLGALSTSIAALVASRVVQGVGAGLVSPAALAGAVSGFPPERRGGALGIWGASAGLANLVGPLMGGLLTVALGWRSNWWALVPLALLSAVAVMRYLPPLGRSTEANLKRSVLNEVVLAATVITALTFAIMIGTFYLAEQYLQRAAGYSALGASAALILVALLVGAAAPIAGRLVDSRGERLPALIGFFAVGLGLAMLSIPSLSLHSPLTIVPLIPVGLGLGMLFVPPSRAALNSNPSASHGRTSAILSIGRLLGAAVGAGLAGIAISGGATASTVHTAMLFACAISLLIGIPASMRLGSTLAAASSPTPG